MDQSGYPLLNLGDVAMLQVAVSRLHERFPDAEIGVLTQAPDRLVRFCPNARPILVSGRSTLLSRGSLFGRASALLASSERFLVHRHTGLASHLAVLKGRIRRRDWQCVEAFSDALHSADLVVASGGGYLTDVFARHASLTFDTLAIAARLGKPIALFGQGLGPIGSQTLWQRAQVLKSVDFIGLREGTHSLMLLRKLGVTRAEIRVTGDDAVSLVLAEPKRKSSSDAIGVCIRGASYAGVSIQLLRVLHHTVRASIDKHQASLVRLSISRYNNDEDSATLDEMFGESTGPEMPQTPSAIIGLISKCRLVITGSYHAAVFALAQGIPALCLSGSTYYRQKFEGLQALFPVGCRMVDLTQPSWPETLRSECDSLWRCGPELADGLRESAARQLEKGRQAYDFVQSWFRPVTSNERRHLTLGGPL